MKNTESDSYWKVIGKQFWKRPLGRLALCVVVLFCFVGIYAPLLASSKPLFVIYDGQWYFPLMRYLFYSGFFTKRLDIFFNLMMFTVPVFLLAFWVCLWRGIRYLPIFISIICVHLLIVAFLFLFPLKDPAVDPKLTRERHEALLANPLPDWNFDLEYMNDYAKLNEVLRYIHSKEQHKKFMRYQAGYATTAKRRWVQGAIREKITELARKKEEVPSDEQLESLVLQEIPPIELGWIVAMPTLWQISQDHEAKKISRQKRILKKATPGSAAYIKAQETLGYLQERRQWLEEQSKKVTARVMPFIRPYHWEDDAGGEQSLNQYVRWWDLTRINRKDLVAGLIFGVRISLVVGVLAVGLALLIGVPVGALAGFYGGKFDIVVSRILEIWESMPTLFMLLLVIAVTQSKSIFLIITVIGLFGWTSFSRYVRGEFFKQRNLLYVEACRSLGFRDRYIIFSHVLPNAIPPLLTLLPFSVMAAITSEAALSFLGLGEEGSCSWGVLMDEGRQAFPGESYLLWPPAILLTTLLVAIALVGDTLRDSLDPKLHR